MSGQALWWKHALLLLRLDGKTLRNSLRMQAAASVMMLAMFVFLPVVILGQVGEVVAGRALHFEGALALAMVFAFMGAFAPFSRPQGAQPSLALPIGERAVFAHGVLRAVVGASAGYGLFLGPACIILVLLGLHDSAGLGVRLLALVGAMVAASVLGRLLYGAAAARSPRLARTVRYGLLLWLSVPAALFVGRADDQMLLDSLGPLGLLARLANMGVNAPAWAGAAVGGGLLLASAGAILVPAAGQSAGTPRKRGPPFTTAGVAAQRRAALPMGVPAARRKYEPLALPRGAQAAISYLGRLWMRSLLYGAGIMAAVGGFAAAMVLLHPQLPRVTLPAIDIRIVLAAGYLTALWFSGLAAAPETQQRMLERVTRQPRGQKRTVKAIFRIGPPPLILKRWSILQTLPVDRHVLERAILRPQLILLVLGTAAMWTFIYVLGRGDAVAVTLGTAMTVTLLLMIGGVLVATRSGKRFAKERDRVLEVTHSVSAALWMAASLPLAMAGLLALVELAIGGTLPFQSAAVLAAWAAGAVGMPAYAYYSAYERLVTTQRPFESKRRVLFLAAAGAAFLAVPFAVFLNSVFG